MKKRIIKTKNDFYVKERGSKMKMNYKNRKKGKLFEKVAELILDNPDCKDEIIWLLKKNFKDNNDLKDSYKDLLND